MSSPLTIEQYSDKSHVVRGDTKPHKENLKGLGCKWNSRLRNGGGWIVSTTKKDAVEEYIERVNKEPVYTPIKDKKEQKKSLPPKAPRKSQKTETKYEEDIGVVETSEDEKSSAPETCCSPRRSLDNEFKASLMVKEILEDCERKVGKEKKKNTKLCRELEDIKSMLKEVADKNARLEEEVKNLKYRFESVSNDLFRQARELERKLAEKREEEQEEQEEEEEEEQENKEVVETDSREGFCGGISVLILLAFFAVAATFLGGYI